MKETRFNLPGKGFEPFLTELQEEWSLLKDLLERESADEKRLVAVSERAWTTADTSVVYLQQRSERERTFLYLSLITLVLLAVHSTAKLYQVSYQTIIMPLFMCLLAVELRHLYDSFRQESRFIASTAFKILFVLSILAYGRTSLSLIDGRPALAALWEQAAFIRAHTDPGDRIFSADSALAPIEADRDILTGMAASDLFADWSTDKCRYYNVLNFDIMEEYVREQAGAMLIYGDLSFNLSLPYLEPVSQARRDTLLKLIGRYYSEKRTFPNLTLPGTQTHYCLPRTHPAGAPVRHLIFGIDAAAWDVLMPLCRQGLLPHIQEALDTGYAARMKTLDPTVSVMLWTTIATGMLPENHGINNWLSEGMDTSGQLAITSDRRKAPAFWNMIDDRNVLVANWWASWPVEAINGVMISNRAHFADLDHAVYPPEQASIIQSADRISRERLEEELSRLNPENRPVRLPDFFARQLLKDRFYLESTRLLMAQESFDVAAVFIRGIDILEHEYLRDVRPEATNIPDIPADQQGIVKAYYRYVDQWLGTFKGLMGPDTGIILVSDHGMDPVDALPPLIEGLDVMKLLGAMARKSGGDFQYRGFVDHRRYPPGLKRGIKWTGAGAPSPRSVQQLANRLQSLTVDGDPLFLKVVVSENPDELIHLALNPAPDFESVIRFKGFEIPLMSVTGMIIHPRSGQHWHAPDGIFLAAGPGIRSRSQLGEIRIQDILPTLLVWMGLPVAEDADGRPDLDIFAPQFLKTHPPHFISSYGSRSDVSRPDVPEDVEDSIRDELESLGYIQVE